MPNDPELGNRLGALATVANDATAYLGDRDYVDGLIRGYVKAVVDRAGDSDTEDKAAQAGKDTQADALALAKVFVGAGGDGITPLKDWNRPGGGLGLWVRMRFIDQIEGLQYLSDEQVIANTLAILAHSVVEATSKHAEDGDAEDAGLSINALTEDWVDLMLGVPNEDETAASIATAGMAMGTDPEPAADAENQPAT